MKVESSQFLTAVKPLLKQLLERLLSEYSYVSILAADSRGKVYKVTKKSKSIVEHELYNERGFVIKVYDGKGYGEYSFNEISRNKLDEIVQRIHDGLIPLSEGLPEGIAESIYKELPDEPVTFARSTDYEQDPEQAEDEEIIEKLQTLTERGLRMDERILDVNASCSYQKYHKIFLSRNRDMEQNVLWTVGTLVVLSKKKDENKIRDCYQAVSGLGGLEILKGMDDLLARTAKNAVDLLDAEPIPPGEYDCICEPDVTGLIAHEAFGHGVEMDMFVKKRALAENYIGQYVASPVVSMRDGARTLPEVASYFFDDEGVLGQDTQIIKNGILQKGICDSQSALALGTVPTGNGRRENTGHKAYTRMTNTIIEAGQDKVEDMIASIAYGFLLQDASSGMEDPKNWGIQCMVNTAREIKDGKLTGKIFSPIVMTGYVPDLLKSISMVSDTVAASGAGACGKGYKEWVKVSDGGPYIKARIRLG